MMTRKATEICKIVVSVWPGLGDVVFTTPVFRTLRKKFPDSRITALVWSQGGKELLTRNPYIDELVRGSFTRTRALLSKFKGYDIGVQCSHPVQLLFILSGIKRRVSFNGNPFWWLYPVADNNFHSTEYYLRAVDQIDGVKLRDGNHWELFIGEDEGKFAQQTLKNANHPIVGIHPGARNNKCKRWEIRKFVSLCNLLKVKFNAQIVLIGGREDIKLCDYIENHIHTGLLNLAGSLTLRESAAVIKHCNLFIGNASGPTYIAAAVGTPVVAILGPENPKNFGFVPPQNARVVTPKLKCAPCLHFYRNFLWGLRLRYVPVCKAIQSIQPEEVFDACAQLLS